MKFPACRALSLVHLSLPLILFVGESHAGQSLTLARAPGGSAEGQTLGQWSFEEGSFLGAGGPGSRTVLDSSGMGNHGYRPDLGRRVSYSTDSFAGRFALDFNSAADPRPNPGHIDMLHDLSLEPAQGFIEARIKIRQHHDAIIFTKATFQWLRREAGPLPPVFTVNGEPRIVGRTVYGLMITSDGSVRGVVGNDGLQPTLGNSGGSWTSTESDNKLMIGGWNHIAMRWNGERLAVFLNGTWSQGVEYRPIPELGLSYRGAGIDPTYGALSLGVSLSSSGFPFVGLMDEVRIAAVGGFKELTPARNPRSGGRP